MFISLDLHFVELFSTFIETAKNDGGLIVSDLFADRPEEERAAIMKYLTRHSIITDMTQMCEDDENVIYVIPSFPLTNFPMPQIGVYMGPETSSDFFVGNNLGKSWPVMKDNATIGYDNAKGYYANVNYRADVVCLSKLEAIWLGKLCQRALAGDIPALEGMDITEHVISAVDTQLENVQFPALVFSRAVTYSGKALQWWKERVPTFQFQEGINKAL
jgi:hypothetical protein